MDETSTGLEPGHLSPPETPQDGIEPPEEVIDLHVDPEREGTRLDVLLAAVVPALTRSSAQRLIEQNRVVVDGRPRPRGFRVHAGALVSVTMPRILPRPALTPQHGDLDILYEDDALLAVNKRPGLVVHPGAGHQSGTLANQLMASGRSFSTLGGPERPGLVHRLDRDTSGVMLIAKTDRAHESLSRQFQERAIQKTYLALVLGPQIPDQGTIESSFGRSPGDRKQFTGKVRTERKAITEYRTVLRAGLTALVMVHPRTGRTHQIRVHLAESGHPIVGDRVYGRAYPRPGSRPESETEALRQITRHALHAFQIRFNHPDDGRPVKVVAPLPRDMRTLLDALFGEAWKDAVEQG